MSRINKADTEGIIRPFYPDTPQHILQPWEITRHDHHNDDDFEDDDSLVTGLFGTQERAMFMQEILQQVVIGMGRLDVGLEENIDPIDKQPSLRSKDTDRVNPYFPSISANFSSTSPPNFHPWSSSASSRSTESMPLHSRNISPINNLSPGTEFPPSLSSTSPSRSPVSLDSTINLNW